MNTVIQSRWILIPVVVSILGILSIGTLFLTNSIHEQMHEHFLLDDWNHDVQADVLKAHLWLEEMYQDYSTVDIDNVMSSIDESIGIIDSKLFGVDIQPIQTSVNKSFITNIKNIRSLIIEFRDEVARITHAGINPAQDNTHDIIFDKFMNNTNALDKDFQVLQARDNARLNQSFLSILILWSAIILFSAIGLFVFERKRKTAEEEVLKHRKHLMEMVEERTSELDTNLIRLENEIIERKRKEEELESMALFAELNPSPVLRFDKNGEVLMANPAAIELFDLEAWAGMYSRMYLKSLIPGIEEFDLAGCIINGRITVHSAQIGNRHFHFTFRGLAERGIGQIYGSDITEKMMIEAEILRASQLASIGELAAGVAHEINNPINGIINFAQIIADKTNTGSIENDGANHIIDEGDRIAKIVASLLSFARDSKKERHPIIFQEVLSESMSMIEAQLRKEGIRMKIAIPSGLPEVNADFQEIEQVCLNIINNARYSSNKKYPRSHKNKVMEIIGKEVKVDGSPYVRIIFHDHGMGIPKDLMDKIMNPFFTTKPTGYGTGLGLSISHNIIRSHGGNLRVQSVEGEGTKAIIDLPAMTKMQIAKNATTGKA
jgi:signal transduction histidine kinase